MRQCRRETFCLLDKYVTKLMQTLDFLPLLGDGRVFAFGNNRYGQLGINPSAHAVSPTPVHVPALDGLGVVQVQCGWHHCIALTGMSLLSRLFSLLIFSLTFHICSVRTSVGLWS